MNNAFDPSERQKILRIAIFYGISLLLSLLIIVISVTFFVMIIYLEGKVSSEFLYIFVSVVIVNFAISALSIRGLMGLYGSFQSEHTDRRTIVFSINNKSHASAERPSAPKLNPEYFTDLELEIIDMLKNHGNRILQSDIAKTINASKASISRVITSLESKGVVVRMRKGVTNEIILVETNFK